MPAKMPKIEKLKDQYVHEHDPNHESSSSEYQDWNFNSPPRPRAERAKKAAEVGCQQIRIRLKGISVGVVGFCWQDHELGVDDWLNLLEFE